MGVCVENAEAYETPTYLCKGDGKWTILTGGCRCKVGYEPDAEKQTCNVCPVGKFRSAEVRACTICPLNSKTNKVGSPFCPCLSGHYRHPRDGKHMPCYKPPGPPTNLTLLFIDQTSAILSWNAPQRAADEQLDSKFRSDIVFRVRCAACTSNVVFNPSSETFNDTKLTLTNLEPVTTYTVQVHSQHGVSYPIVSPEGMHGGASGYENGSLAPGASGYHATEPPMVMVNARAGGSGSSSDLDDIKTEFAEITFTTESAILSTVFNVKVVQITNKDVDLVWDKPIHSDSPIEYYEVRWFPKSEVDAMNKSVLSTKESKVHIGDLLENTEYGFQVRCKTLNGWGTFSNIVYAQTHQSVSPVYDDSFQMRIVAGTTVTVVFILVLVIVVTVVFLRSKNHDEIDKKTNNHLPLPLDYASNEGNALLIELNPTLSLSLSSQSFSSSTAPFSFHIHNALSLFLPRHQFVYSCVCVSIAVRVCEFVCIAWKTLSFIRCEGSLLPSELREEGKTKSESDENNIHTETLDSLAVLQLPDKTTLNTFYSVGWLCVCVVRVHV
uniref:Fibronectin type-III domain-containing protein n=1 Tax=Anopheles maculatus TaxID=74869 RepID=A0A182SA04_9DIPT